RVIWLRNGELALEGDPTAVCQEYYAATMVSPGPASVETVQRIPQQQTGMARFSLISLSNKKGRPSEFFCVGEDIHIDFELVAESSLDATVFAVSVYGSEGEWLIGQTSREENVVWPKVMAGEVLKGSLILTANCFAHGSYFLALAAYSPDLSICYALTDLSRKFS